MYMVVMAKVWCSVWLQFDGVGGLVGTWKGNRTDDGGGSVDDGVLSVERFMAAVVSMILGWLWRHGRSSRRSRMLVVEDVGCRRGNVGFVVHICIWVSNTNRFKW
ncbi:pollen-specific leucine-rich repeat extensin-like protein 4 [Iris pallida]|uniref:Pollen-specific leucine-rich repeat extensin-like protein 4 n=1 Tax=Iris pallida TaxID=29817 RepID=A0AAX6G981_IRIPA|nr:pollen-specific leucine-rich repeat extensin-like protein 4 [Iris pallida]